MNDDGCTLSRSRSCFASVPDLFRSGIEERVGALRRGSDPGPPEHAGVGSEDQRASEWRLFGVRHRARIAEGLSADGSRGQWTGHATSCRDSPAAFRGWAGEVAARCSADHEAHGRNSHLLELQVTGEPSAVVSPTGSLPPLPHFLPRRSFSYFSVGGQRVALEEGRGLEQHGTFSCLSVTNGNGHGQAECSLASSPQSSFTEHLSGRLALDTLHYVPEEDRQAVVREMFESYFSDRRIWGLIQNLSSRAISRSGWCSIIPITQFAKVRAVTTSMEAIVEAIRQSTTLELSHDARRVRRTDRPNLLAAIAAARSWRNTVYMLGFPKSTKEGDVANHFSAYGRIVAVTLCPSLEEAPTTALVEFLTADMASRCIAEGKGYFNGCRIEIMSRRVAKRKWSGGGGGGGFSRGGTAEYGRLETPQLSPEGQGPLEAERWLEGSPAPATHELMWAPQYLRQNTR